MSLFFDGSKSYYKGRVVAGNDGPPNMDNSTGKASHFDELRENLETLVRQYVSSGWVLN